MSRCIAKFRTGVRAFLCTEMETIIYTKAIETEKCDIILILDDDSTINISFTMNNIKQCSNMIEDMIGDDKDEDYFDKSANPEGIDDCLKAVDECLDLNSGMFRLAMLIHSTSSYKEQISAELREDIMKYLDRNLAYSLKLFDHLRINELVNSLLMYNPRPQRLDFIIYNFNLESHIVIKMFSLGYKLDFDGIIDKVLDTQVLLEAVRHGLVIKKIYNGDYLTNEILELCEMITHLNVDSNSYVTRLGPSAGILEELHCCRSSGIRQAEIDLCINLKRLYADDNPHLTMCHPDKLETLSVKGARYMRFDFICSLPNLKELSISCADDIQMIPRYINKLCLSGYYDFLSPLNCEHIEYLEVDDGELKFTIGSVLNTLIINGYPDKPNIKHCNISSAVNLEVLIDARRGFVNIDYMTKLRHLELKSACIRIDDIPNPEKLEILKVNKFISGSDIVTGEISRPSHRTRSDSDDEGGSIKIRRIDKFTNLHTLHIYDPKYGVELSENLHVEELKCNIFTGYMYGLKRLIVGENIPIILKDWTLEHKASIEYLEGGTSDSLDIREYANLKDHYVIDNCRLSKEPIPDLMLISNITYSKELSEFNEEAINHARMILHEELRDRAGNSPVLYSKAFSNLRTLNLRYSGRNGACCIDCRHLPLLEDLSVNEGIYVMFSNKLERLEKFTVCDISLQGDYDDTSDLNRPDELNCISNALLRELVLTLKIYRGGESGKSEDIIVESKWLKKLTINNNHDRRLRIDRLILNSPYIEELSIEKCREVEIINHANFTSLINYSADILLNLEESRNTLRTITLPRGGVLDIPRFSKNLYPFLIGGRVVRSELMIWSGAFGRDGNMYSILDNRDRAATAGRYHESSDDSDRESRHRAALMERRNHNRRNMMDQDDTDDNAQPRLDNSAEIRRRPYAGSAMMPRRYTRRDPNAPNISAGYMRREELDNSDSGDAV